MSDPSAAAVNAGHQPLPTYAGYPAPPPLESGSHPPPHRDDNNGLAIAALVTALVGLVCGGSLLGLIFGIIALVQIRRTGQRGRGMAISGIVIGGLQAVAIGAILVVGIIAAINEGNLRDESGEITSAGDVTLAELAPGDCVNGLSAEEDEMFSELPAVPCAEPHQGEVVAIFDLPKGDWPGEDAAYEQAWDGCVDRFADYSFEAYDDPSVGMFYLAPTRTTWRLGDREVICIAEFLEGERTGSIRD